MVEVLSADAIVLFDKARRAHLDGRDGEAVAAYRDAFRVGLNKAMTTAAHYSVGLAFLDADDAGAAVEAFKIALDDSVRDWRDSSHFYLGRAYAALGDLPSAREAIGESDVPTASAELAQLGTQP